MTKELTLLRAHGRCTGALIFAVFGGVWLLLSCAYFHRFRPLQITVICLFCGLLVMAALRTRRGHGEPVLSGDLLQQKSREDRRFAAINGFTYGAVLLLFLILPRVGLANFIFPGFVALVGLHFLPMPPLYRHTANSVIGSFMVLWAIFCAIRFKADGNIMAAWVTLGAGIALWFSSLWALQKARALFNSMA